MERLSTYSFLEEYRQYIQPAIADIDVFLKSAEYPLCAADVACVLDICQSEVAHIMQKSGADSISRSVFFDIMRAGQSRICRLYAREFEMQSPIIYSAGQIAYIYNLDDGLVKNACQKLQITEVTANTMPLIFAHIPHQK